MIDLNLYLDFICVCVEGGYPNQERRVHAFFFILLPHPQCCYVALLWFAPQGSLRCGKSLYFVNIFIYLYIINLLFIISLVIFV